VHAVGVQAGLVHVPWRANVSLRYLYEYAATDRFQGQSIGLNVGIGF